MAKLSDVNTTDIRDAISLGCRTLSRTFNADNDDIPFWDAAVRPVAEMGTSHISTVAHMPGRALNALLNAEAAAGITIDEGAVDKHTRAAFLSYDGPIPLPLDPSEIGGEPNTLIPHSIREGLHALHALARYRDSARARRLAEETIAAIFQYWDAEEGWDKRRIEREHNVSVDLEYAKGFISGLARSIGPLAKYFRATAYGPALELAVVFKEKAIGEFFTEDGALDASFGDHTHSVTSVMSSLAQLADLIHDSHLMKRVKRFYDNGLWDIRDELGWSDKIIGPGQDSAPDRGEVNSTGDIVETALILGRWGYTENYHDAERIVRGHLLPSQLRDISFIQEPANPSGLDGRRDVARRLRGAFGFPAPYGHEPLGVPSIRFNLDVVGGAVSSLCEVYRDATRYDEARHYVNLLFDHETPDIQVLSPYTHPSLGVRLKKPGQLFVRVPPWVDQHSLTVSGVPGRPSYDNGYLFIADPPVNRTITLDFPLRNQEIVLDHGSRQIRTHLRGDQVVAMDNFGADTIFFDPID